MIFREKQELLSLYNAVNKTHYEDPEQLQVNTLENAIYMSMKNDLSFVIDSRLNLYEHQSTYSPNLPLSSSTPLGVLAARCASCLHDIFLCAPLPSAGGCISDGGVTHI